MIAAHYCKLFGINPVSKFRLTLNEITKESLKEAFDNARAIDEKLVDAYETRRAISRLFLYKLNPILWHTIYRGISLGYSQAIILRIICEQEKKLPIISDPLEIDELIEEWNRPLTWKTLQLTVAREFSLNSGVVSLTMRQLYEGVNIANTCMGLITYYKGDSIMPSSEMKNPEDVKEFLTPNQFKIYDLIWKHYNRVQLNSLESYETKKMTRYNDYLLMRELESKGFPWVETFSKTICSMVKRNYIELTDEGYKPTQLGNSIMNVIKDYFITMLNAKAIHKIEDQIKSMLNDKEDKWEVMESFYKQFNNYLNKAYDKLGDDLKPKEPPTIETDEICDKCGRKMVLRRSRYGTFLACSGYPECKNAKQYFEYMEEKCPKCGGRLTIRKMKRGHVYYSCEHYPDCNFSTWDEPQNMTCDKCGSTLLIHRFKDRAPMIYCSNDDCVLRKDHPINKILENLRQKSEVSKQRRAKRASKK